MVQNQQSYFLSGYVSPFLILEFRNENSLNEGSMSWYDLENVKSFKEPFWCNGLFGANPANADARIQFHAICFTQAYQWVEVKVELRNAYCMIQKKLYYANSVEANSFFSEYTIFTFEEQNKKENEWTDNDDQTVEKILRNFSIFKVQKIHALES